MTLNEDEINITEKELAGLPIFEYAYIKTADIPFSEKVRYICESECPMYDKSWSCPPAVGSVGDCIAKCRSYENAFFFSTLAHTDDASDMSKTLPTRKAHQETVRDVSAVFTSHYGDILALSAESCAVCDKCAWPESSCRHPDKMLMCIESQGILVTELAEKCGMSFMLPDNMIVWFGLILY